MKTDKELAFRVAEVVRAAFAYAEAKAKTMTMYNSANEQFSDKCSNDLLESVGRMKTDTLDFALSIWERESGIAQKVD